MIKVYIIGSNKFNRLKKEVFDYLKYYQGLKYNIKAVGFSKEFDEALKNNDIELLHSLENKAIEEADIVILVDVSDLCSNENPHVGNDTLREIEYAKKINKNVYRIKEILN